MALQMRLEFTLLFPPRRLVASTAHRGGGLFVNCARDEYHSLRRIGVVSETT